MLVTICKRLLARSVAGTAKKRTRKQANCVELHPLATHVMLECYESDYRSMHICSLVTRSLSEVSRTKSDVSYLGSYRPREALNGIRITPRAVLYNAILVRKIVLGSYRTQLFPTYAVSAPWDGLGRSLQNLRCMQCSQSCRLCQ